MKCPNCNFEVADNTKFCPECGTKIFEMTAEPTSSSEVTDETSNVTSTTEINEKKNAKKKKIKKIIIISATALVACGIIFLTLYLLNPFCMFGHDMNKTNHVEPTCAANGYDEYSCSDCDYAYKNTLSNRDIKHKWDDIPCGEENTCVNCGEKKTFQHELEFFHDTCCKNCGQDKFIIKMPTTPITVHEYDSRNNKEQSCIVTQLEAKLWDDHVSITFTVKSTYHENGSNYSAKANFGWKLYDSDGTVIDSGTAYSDGNIVVGEQSKGTFYLLHLTSWNEYRLEILDLG